MSWLMTWLHTFATVVGAMVLVAWVAGMLGLIDFHIYIGPARDKPAAHPTVVADERDLTT